MHKKLHQIGSAIKRAYSHFLDKDIPLSYKIIPVIAIVYLLYPFDLLSDLIPFLGQADDLTILSLALAFFVDISDKKRAKKQLVEHAESAD